LGALIKDGEVYTRHVEYIHYNPVKHGLVGAPIDLKCSSFHSYVEMGIYNNNWNSCVFIFGEDIGAV